MSKTFQDDKGNNSAMRMMSFISLLASIAFGFITIQEISAGASFSYQAGLIGVYITFGFLLAAFAPKAVQKFAEKIPAINK